MQSCKSHHYPDKSIIKISRSLTKKLLERELTPLFAQQFGSLIFPTPHNNPINYLFKKLEKANNPEQQNNILRLLYLSNILDIIDQLNCDRLAVWLTSFESYHTSIIQLSRLNTRKNITCEIERTLRSFPRSFKNARDIMFKDYNRNPFRFYAMFLFSQKNNLIESMNLQQFRPQMDFSEMLNPNIIVKNYHELLMPKAPYTKIFQLRHEIFSEPVPEEQD